MTELEIAREKINQIDKQIAELFSERLDAVRTVADYKKKNALPIDDPAREEQLLRQNSSFIGNKAYLPYYTEFQRQLFQISKEYQRQWMEETP